MESDDFTIVPLPLYALVLIILFCWPASLLAEPLFRVNTPDGVVITLHKEKCELNEVVNLPQHATWDEKGKTFKGCWGFNPIGVVMLYFSDKTVATVPASAFSKVIGV